MTSTKTTTINLSIPGDYAPSGFNRISLLVCQARIKVYYCALAVGLQSCFISEAQKDGIDSLESDRGGGVKLLELSYDDLLRRELIERDITLTCVSNQVGGSYVGNARWLGTRLADLLREAGVQDGADQVVGRSVDGWACGFPVADALDGRDAMVVVGMNGEPLPLEHGFPVRLVVPGLYGFVSATKWLTEIELTTFADFDHYWLRRGWAQKAPIKTMSRIDTPRGSPRCRPASSPSPAWRGRRPRDLRRRGPQSTTVRGRPPSSPRRRARTRGGNGFIGSDARPGRRSITVRATDGTGAVQVEERAEPIPDGASGLPPDHRAGGVTDLDEVLDNVVQPQDGISAGDAVPRPGSNPNAPSPRISPDGISNPSVPETSSDRHQRRRADPTAVDVNAPKGPP